CPPGAAAATARAHVSARDRRRAARRGRGTARWSDRGRGTGDGRRRTGDGGRGTGLLSPVSRPPSPVSGLRSPAPGCRRRWSSWLPPVTPGPLEIRLDERINLAVHDGDDVAGFGVRAVVLDQRVRLEHIGADLVAPLDGALLAAQLRHLRLALLPLD